MARRMMDILNEIVPKDSTPGQMVKAFRKREGLTLEQVNDLTQIQISNLSAIENDKIPVTQHYAEIFAIVFAVHPSVFLYPNGQFAKDSELLEIEKRVKKFRRHG